MANPGGSSLSTILRLIKGEDMVIVGIAVYLAGVIAAGKWVPDQELSTLIIACIFCMLGVAGVNSMNQVHDLKIDSINKPKRPLPAKIMSVGQVKTISTSLLIFGALLAIILWLWVSPIFFIIGCMGLGSALLYTLPEVRLKKFTIISTAIMGFGYGPFLFIAGWIIYEPIGSIPIWVLFFLYFHETFILITKDYRDVDGDKKYDIKTLPVILGKKKAAILNYILYILPFLVLALLGSWNILTHDFTLLVLTGVIIGIPMFALCAHKNININVVGYYVYIFAFILVRILISYILM